jgi:glycosyltransferase involved in cell wall biosynthesis
LTISIQKYLKRNVPTKSLLLFLNKNRTFLNKNGNFLNKMKQPENLIQLNHEKVLKHPYLQTSYLDQFDLHEMYGDLPPITAIVPTYNRAPHTFGEDSNPLGWCLESLLAQEGPGLSEIVVVDDASTDYTLEVVEHFSKISSVPINYHKNSKNFGSSITKNIGTRMSSNNLVLFLDDDCIFSKYLVFGAGYVFNELGGEIGALHLPVYQRKTVPDPISLRNIGIFDSCSGVITGNHNGFPIEYAENLEDNLMEGDLKIPRPLKISTLAGIFLSRKDFLGDVGGYPEFFTWKNGYREETHLGLSLQKFEKDLFFVPDPKFYCVHLKYGAHGEENVIADLDPKLSRLVTQSNIPYIETGNRVDPEEWFFSRIISTFVTLGISDVEAAKRYATETQKIFVENNDLAMSGVKGIKINDVGDRMRIFSKAINEGSTLLASIVGGFE